MDTYAFQAELTRISSIGMTAQGLRMDVGFIGSITEGRLIGHTIEGIDYLLVRSDGVGLINARELISDGDRAIAAVRAEGYIVPPSPELSVLANPNFQWPNADQPVHGARFWETSDEDLSTAAATVFGFTGTVNMVTRVLKISARSLARRSEPNQ